MEESDQMEYDWGELDGEEEPLFADDIEDEDLPPLPPPMPPLTHLSQTANSSAAAALRVNTSENFIGSAAGAGDGTDGQAAGAMKRKPMLTLTTDRIFSDKGLPALERDFPKLKFQGKGHEAEDLKYLLQQYEHWANRLYPKLTFKDVTDRIEKLATKGEFKTKLVKMRRKSVMGVGTPGTEDNDEDPTLQIPPQDMDVGSHASETELGGGMNESSTVSHTSRTTTPNINDTSRPVLHEHSGAPQHISPDKDGSHVNRGRSQNGLQRRGSDGTPNPWEEEEEDRGTRVGGGRTRRLSSDEESEDGALVIADDDGDNSGPASPHTVSAGSL